MKLKIPFLCFILIPMLFMIACDTGTKITGTSGSGYDSGTVSTDSTGTDEKATALQYDDIDIEGIAGNNQENPYVISTKGAFAKLYSGYEIGLKGKALAYSTDAFFEKHCVAVITTKEMFQAYYNEIVSVVRENGKINVVLTQQVGSSVSVEMFPYYRHVLLILDKDAVGSEDNINVTRAYDDSKTYDNLDQYEQDLKSKTASDLEKLEKYKP
jgi:hypothetical protein